MKELVQQIYSESVFSSQDLSGTRFFLVHVNGAPFTKSIYDSTMKFPAGVGAKPVSAVENN